MKKTENVWILVQKDTGETWDGRWHYLRKYALGVKKEMPQFKFLKVVKATITYEIPTPKEKN